MTPINNSDTAWLIVSDFNQDNNLPYEDLREDVLNPEIDQYMFEFIEMYFKGVGFEDDFNEELWDWQVGDGNSIHVISELVGSRVGAHVGDESRLVGGKHHYSLDWTIQHEVIQAVPRGALT